jgi:hypothetical protein
LSTKAGHPNSIGLKRNGSKFPKRRFSFSDLRITVERS